MSQLTLTLLCDWIRPLITSGARVVPGRLPDMPNRVIGITKASGPGLEMEGMFDVIGIAISCRGGENNLNDAETIANEVDDIFLGKHPNAQSENFLIGNPSTGFQLNGIGRRGSGPVTSNMPDTLSRWTFTCTYYAYVSTNVGQVY